MNQRNHLKCLTVAKDSSIQDIRPEKVAPYQKGNAGDEFAVFASILKAKIYTYICPHINMQRLPCVFNLFLAPNLGFFGLRHKNRLILL